MKKIFSIVSGAKSGALNIALEISTDLKKRGFNVKDIFRKYNKTDITDAVVLSDQCTIDYIFQLSQLIKKERPDLIIVHGYSTHIWTKIAVAISKVSVKLIHVEHNREKYSMIRSFLTKKLDKYTDKYICVSNGVAENLARQGIDKNKEVVIYNGIDKNKFFNKKMGNEVFTIGMVGRFSKQKNQIILIKAVEKIIKADVPIKLILMGSGKTKKNCEKYVKKSNLEENIVFVEGKFTDLISKLDLFVLSTKYEGLPLVVCEAMAANIPVIATNVPGVDEIIEDQVNGLLTKLNDYDDLANKVLNCINDKGLMQKLTYNAQNTVNYKFSQHKMLHNYYNEIISLV